MKASPSELVPMARTILTELKEYSEDMAYQYDTDLYYDWKSRIDAAVSNYERGADNAENSLRAVISVANEHVADYEMKWAEGSVMVRSLLTAVSVGAGAAAVSEGRRCPAGSPEASPDRHWVRTIW